MASNYTPKSYLNMAKNRQQINKGPYSHSDGRNIGDGVEFIPENWKKGVFEKEDLSDNILKDLSQLKLSGRHFHDGNDNQDHDGNDNQDHDGNEHRDHDARNDQAQP